MNDDDLPISDAEQARAAALLAMTEEVVAPASLHASVRAMTEGTASGPGRSSWRPRVLAPAALALAALIVAIVLGVAGGGGAPTTAQAARLALAPATAPAPAPDASDHSRLDVSQAGIPFPSYLKGDGWTATGVRHDTLRGRSVTTVFYRSPGGTRVGYAIVSGQALTAPRGRVRTIGGIRYVVTSADGGWLVTWWRQGHTCVIAGRGISDATLFSLARSDERTA